MNGTTTGAPAVTVRDLRRRLGRGLFGRPEAGELPGNCADRPLAADPSPQVAVLVVQPPLAAPADLHHLLGHPLLVLSQCLADRRLQPGVVGGLAQDMAEQPVAGLGDVATTARAAARGSLGTSPT